MRRCLSIKDLQINDQIRDKEVRLIGMNGEQVGIISVKEAQKIADDNKLDLVKVAPQASMKCKRKKKKLEKIKK